MDPVTQGVLGAIASQNVSRKKCIAAASVLGFLSGMAADLDIFIRSDIDPMLFLEYHRQFTHSLIFIPFGGFICSVIFYWLLRSPLKLRFGQFYLYCTSGYATHALLDACTSYGTQLFWPFSDMRVAWNTISIVDPLFTLPLLVLVVIAAIKRQPRYARVAAIWVFTYMCMGVVQRERAEAAGWELAASRGHAPVRLEAKPGFANIFIWKTLYQFQDRFYVDGVRTGIKTRFYPGDSIAKLEVENDFPWLVPGSQQARDIQRFRWFSDDFVALHPTNPNRVIDIRYSIIPNKIDAFWMIELDRMAAPHQHVSYVHEHDNSGDSARQYWRMMWN